MEIAHRNDLTTEHSLDIVYKLNTVLLSKKMRLICTLEVSHEGRIHIIDGLHFQIVVLSFCAHLNFTELDDQGWLTDKEAYREQQDGGGYMVEGVITQCALYNRIFI